MRNFYFKFARLIEIVFDRLVAHPRRTVAAAVFIIAGAAAALPHLKSELRIYDLRDPKFPSTLDLQSVKNQFNLGNSIFIVLANRDGSPLTTGQLCVIDRWIMTEKRENAELLGTFSPLDLRRPVMDGLKMWYKKILDLKCDEPSDRPLQAAFGESPWVGGLLSRDLSDVAIEFKFRDTEGASRYGRFNPIPIGDLWAKLGEDILSPHPELTAHLGGRSAFQWHYQRLLKQDSWYNGLAIAVLVAGCKYFYGTWISGVLLVSTLGFSLLILLGAMSLAGAPIDLLTNSLFVMMCVATIEDFVFVAHASAHAAGSSIAEFRRIALAAFLTSFTTVIGFASLMISDLGIVRRFGFWGASAAAIEWAVTFFVLPSVLILFGLDKKWFGRETPRWPDRVAALNTSRAWPKASVAIFAAAVCAAAWLNFNDSPRETFDSSHIYRQAYDHVSKTRGWESSVSVLFPDASLRDGNERLLREIAKEPNVAAIDDPYQVASYLTTGLAPLTADLVRGDLTITEMWKRYVSDTGEMLAVVYVKNFDSKEVTKTIDRIREVCGKACRPVGEGVVYAEYTRSIVSTLFESLGLTLIIVSLTIWGLAIVYGAPRPALIIYTVLWCPLVAVGIVAAGQITVNFVTCLFAPVFVGLAGDNAIQYILAMNDDRLETGIARRGGATVQLTVLAIAASLVFTCFTMVAMRTLGLLLAGGFVLLLLGDLFLLKGLFRSR